MQFGHLLFLYTIILIFIVAFDLFWINTVAKNFYTNNVDNILRLSMIPAIIFYLIFPAAHVYNIIRCNHSIKDLKLHTVAIDGAILGFIVYATYNLTNVATVKNWSTVMSIMDTLWGTFITAVSGTLAVIIASQFI